jgi:hypothetical protein
MSRWLASFNLTANHATVRVSRDQNGLIGMADQQESSFCYRLTDRSCLKTGTAQNVCSSSSLPTTSCGARRNSEVHKKLCVTSLQNRQAVQSMAICCHYCRPQTDVEVGKTHFRNVRSKCRCSMCLQFTLIHAASCVLHRPTSQVIHRSELFLYRNGPANSITRIK